MLVAATGTRVPTVANTSAATAPTLGFNQEANTEMTPRWTSEANESM